MSPAGLDVLERYGVLILPALAVAEQIGIPLPAMPALLTVGALAAHGRISIPLVLAATSVASLAVDFAWYELGRRCGAQMLSKICAVSFAPSSYFRRAQDIFRRHGARGMLAAKVVPGLTTIMPLLSGVFNVARLRFGLYDLGGVLLWAGTWLGLGYFFSDAIVVIAAGALAFGRLLTFIIGTALATYILVKYARRQVSQLTLQTALESGPRLSMDRRAPCARRTDVLTTSTSDRQY